MTPTPSLEHFIIDHVISPSGLCFILYILTLGLIGCLNSSFTCKCPYHALDGIFACTHPLASLFAHAHAFLHLLHVGQWRTIFQLHLFIGNAFSSVDTCFPCLQLPSRFPLGAFSATLLQHTSCMLLLSRTNKTLSWFLVVQENIPNPIVKKSGCRSLLQLPSHY